MPAFTPRLPGILKKLEPGDEHHARLARPLHPQSMPLYSHLTGILKKLEPDERRAKIRSELQHFAPSRTDLYVPTNPECRVVAHIPKSGTPMQSAAKVGHAVPTGTGFWWEGRWCSGVLFDQPMRNMAR